MDIVDTQVRDNTPPETRRTLERLVAAGHTLEDARRNSSGRASADQWLALATGISSVVQLSSARPRSPNRPMVDRIWLPWP